MRPLNQQEVPWAVKAARGVFTVKPTAIVCLLFKLEKPRIRKYPVALVVERESCSLWEAGLGRRSPVDLDGPSASL